MKAREIIIFICDDPDDEASRALAGWVTGSRRFQAFVEAHRTKIRKKLRAGAATGSMTGVLLELEVASRFVEDRRCLVEYERYGQGRVRSPDLTVTFRTRTTVHLEVTQLQAPAPAPDGARDWESKLIGVVCHKLGQLVPEEINVLVIASKEGALTRDDVAGAMRRLKERVERRDTELLTRFGYADPAAFFKAFQWLSGIVPWKGGGVWVNPQTRRQVPAEIIALLVQHRIPRLPRLNPEELEAFERDIDSARAELPPVTETPWND